MLSGLNHLTLAVSELAASVAFYQQLPGMRLHARWDSGAYFSCGGLWLCLSLDPMRQKTPPETSDYTHYAFSVAAEQFTEVTAQLATGGTVVWKENRSEGESYYFLDPDGCLSGTALCRHGVLRRVMNYSSLLPDLRVQIHSGELMELNSMALSLSFCAFKNNPSWLSDISRIK